MEIHISKEQARGCGYRHSGPDGVGLYLVGGSIWEICERLPFPVGVCPCCGEGIAFGRGYTWINPRKLFASHLNPKCLERTTGPIPLLFANHNHDLCSMCSPPDGRHGLMWVGEKFYSPHSFMLEASTRGISKRVASLPKGFEFGKTIIYLAHKKAIPAKGDEPDKAAVFTVFLPQRLEIVVDTTNPDELPQRALSIAKRLGENARIVKVEPQYEQQSLLKEAE